MARATVRVSGRRAMAFVTCIGALFMLHLVRLVLDHALVVRLFDPLYRVALLVLNPRHAFPTVSYAPRPP